MNHNQNACQCKRPSWCTWLRWLVAAILAFLLLRGCMAEKAAIVAPAVVAGATTAATTSTAPAVAPTAPTVAPTVEPTTTAPTDMAKNAACADTLKQAVEFDTGSAKLTAKGSKQLDMVSECLSAGKFEIAGHTDAQGNDNFNQTLSEVRAKAVLGYLSQKGVDKERMSAKGYGETQAIASNDTAEGRQQNRRIAFVPLP